MVSCSSNFVAVLPRLMWAVCSAIPEELTSLKGIESDTWVQLVASTLHVVAGEDGSKSVKLPPNVAARHRLGASLGTKIKVGPSTLIAIFIMICMM